MNDYHKSEEYVNSCLRGELLYGNDFDNHEIKSWFEDEKEGYYNLSSHETSTPGYAYHELNKTHGFKYLPEGMRFDRALGIGSAYGLEFMPILDRCKNITILEPSKGFHKNSLEGVALNYVVPDSSGVMPFQDNEFDLLTCLGVLHHIPNVEFVLTELFRCLRSGGYALIREPVNSMGDWRKPRVGLTRRERGIPGKLFHTMVMSAGFEIVHESRCVFSLTSRLKFMAEEVYNNKWITMFDKYLCMLPVWRSVYHPVSFYQKLRPAAVYYVLKKP